MSREGPLGRYPGVASVEGVSLPADSGFQGGTWLLFFSTLEKPGVGGEKAAVVTLVPCRHED